VHELQPPHEHELLHVLDFVPQFPQSA